MDDEEKNDGLGQSVKNAQEAKAKVDEQSKKAKKTIKVIKFLIKHPYLLLILRNSYFINYCYICNSLYRRW